MYLWFKPLRALALTADSGSIWPLKTLGAAGKKSLPEVTM